MSLNVNSLIFKDIHWLSSFEMSTTIGQIMYVPGTLRTTFTNPSSPGFNGGHPTFFSTGVKA